MKSADCVAGMEHARCDEVGEDSREGGSDDEEEPAVSLPEFDNNQPFRPSHPLSLPFMGRPRGGIEMRLLQGFISVLALFSVVTAALGQRSATPTDDLLAADKALRKAYAEKDLDKTMAFYDEHALMVRPNFYRSGGKAVLEKLISWEFAIPEYKVLWHPKNLGIGRPGFAYTSGTYELTFKDSSGKTVSDGGQYSTVWKKQADGTWKVLNDFLISDNEDANIENFHVKE